MPARPDLRQEIEARKSRIAELRKQRDAHARSMGWGVVVPPAPLLDAHPPAVYTRVLRAAPLPASLQGSAGEQGSEARPAPKEHGSEAPKEHSEAPTEAPKEAHSEPRSEPLRSRSSVSPALLAFADNAFRAIARSRTASAFSPYSGLRPTARDVLLNTSSLPRALTLEISSLNVEFSAVNADLIAVRTDAHRIALYSLSSPKSPEFLLRSPAALTTTPVFHPHNKQLLFCGSSNGQIFAWDLSVGGRYEVLPVLRSAPDGYRVLQLQFPSEGNALISLQENSVVCVWPGGDRLGKPQSRVLLDDALRGALQSLRLAVLVPFSFAVCFPPSFGFGLGNGTGLFVLSTVQGNLLQLPPLPTSSATCVGWPHFRHSAPVLSMEFRKRLVRTRYAPLLTAGMDWCAKVWLLPVDASGAEPQIAANISVDFAVKCARWLPNAPSAVLLAGEEEVQVFDLNKSTAAPVLSVNVGAEITDVSVSGGVLAVACASKLDIFALPDFSGPDWLETVGDPKG